MRATQIPLGARIITVADAYDAMTSDSPYRAALSPEIALAELRRGAGRQFDPDLVEAFIACYRSEAQPPWSRSPSLRPVVFILVIAVAGGLLAGALLGARSPISSSSRCVSPGSSCWPWRCRSWPSAARRPPPHTVVVGLHLLSYALLLTCVAANLRRPPVMLFGLGVLSNTLAIVLNHGYMPASRAALRLAGLPVSSVPHNNSELAGAGTHLTVLGDIFALPHGVPLANIFSIGDILIAVGLAWLIAEAMRRPAVARPRPVPVAPSSTE